MNRKIVFDSSCDLLDERTVPYATVPLKIITDEKEYIDDHSLNAAQMVAELAVYPGRSTTSCPNAAEWLDAFGDAKEVYTVTITGGLSGSYHSAVLAKNDYLEEHPDRKVCVVDSKSAGPGCAMLVQKLEELVQKTLTFEEICIAIEHYRSKIHLLFSLESLKNLAKNGRVNPAVASVAGFLGIRALGIANEKGQLSMLHKCRGEKSTLEKIFQEMLARGYQGGKVLIHHCLNETGAKRLEARILQLYPTAEIQIRPTAGLCSYYAEKGGLMVGFEG